MKEAVVVTSLRTAVGKAPRGALKDFRPDDMAGAVIRAAIEQTPGLEPGMVESWSAGLQQVAREANLKLALRPPQPSAIGGRRGKHSAAFAALLDELTEVYRLEPDAAW